MSGQVRWTVELLKDHLRLLNSAWPGPPIADSWKYRTIADFLLREGEAFRPRPLPVNVNPGELKECYKNAWLLSISQLEPRLDYVEGYAVGKVIPIAHAWCADVDGRVLDPTWDQRDGFPGLGVAYFGVRIARRCVAKAVTGQAGGVIDDWRNGYPVLAGAQDWRIKKSSIGVAI